MIELPRRAEALHPGMIAVTSNAILTDQLLMEWRRGERFQDRQAGGRKPADVLRLVAGHTALRLNPLECHMTGKAIRFQLAMT